MDADKFEFPSTWPGLMSNESDLNEEELKQERLDGLPITEIEIMDRALSILEERPSWEIGVLAKAEPDQALEEIAKKLYYDKAEQELISECRDES